MRTVGFGLINYNMNKFVCGLSIGLILMKKKIFGTISFQIVTLGLLSVVAPGQTESAEKEKSKSFEEVVGDASKGLQTGSWVTLGNISHIMGNNISVAGYQVASPAEQANAPYGDKGVEIQIESKISLAVRTYTRKVKGNGYLGSPPPNVEFKHAIRFGNDNTVTDNGSSFFGNPPESGKYKIDGNTVILELRGVTGSTYVQKYTLSDDGLTITGEAGAVLTVSLAGKTYSRKFKGRPMGSPNEVEFEHSVQFKDDETLTDNANTFFGNPPATNKYKIAKGTVVIDLGDGKTESYQLSKDLKTLTNEAGAVLTLNKN